MRSGDRVIVQHYLEDGELHDFHGVAREKERPNDSLARRIVTLDDTSRLPEDLQEHHAECGGLFYADHEIRPEGEMHG